MSDKMKQLKEHYQKLVELSKPSEGSVVDIKKTMETNKLLFACMKDVFQQGTEAEKKEALALFGQIAEFFTQQAAKISKKTPFSEAGLLNLSSSPHLYTPEQWKVIQGIKSDMAKLEEGIRDFVPKEKNLSD